MIIDNDFSKTILENLYDGVYFVDCDRKILYWNKGAVEIFSDSSPKLVITQRIKELEKMALLDPLTELANRRYIELNMQTKLDEMRRYGRPFGILFMDRSVIFLCEQASRPC